MLKIILKKTKVSKWFENVQSDLDNLKNGSCFEPVNLHDTDL